MCCLFKAQLYFGGLISSLQRPAVVLGCWRADWETPTFAGTGTTKEEIGMCVTHTYPSRGSCGTVR